MEELLKDPRAPLAALGAYAAIVGLITLRLCFSSAPAAEPAASFRAFRFAPSPAFTIDNPAVSRGSVGHDGVDHNSALSLPLQIQWLKPVNVGVIGGGTAEPAVDATGVYVGADTGWTQALSSDGEARWSYFDSNAVGGVTGAPALDSKQTYVGSAAGNLVAIDKLSGRVTWMQRFDGAISGAPVVFEESVYATVSSGAGTSFVIRMKRSDGSVEWTSDLIRANSNSGPAIDRVSGLVFVGATDRRVHAFSLKSGHQTWERELDADVDATPSIIAGTLFVASNGEFTYAIKAASGEVSWKALVLGGSRASVTWEPATNIVLVGTNRGILYALDRHSGKTRWIDKTGTIFSGLAGAASVSRSKKDESSRLIWVTCADLVFCGLDPHTGKIVEQVKTLGPVASSPVIFGDALYIVESTGALRKYAAKR